MACYYPDMMELQIKEGPIVPTDSTRCVLLYELQTNLESIKPPQIEMFSINLAKNVTLSGFIYSNYPGFARQLNQYFSSLIQTNLYLQGGQQYLEGFDNILQIFANLLLSQKDLQSHFSAVLKQQYNTGFYFISLSMNCVLQIGDRLYFAKDFKTCTGIQFLKLEYKANKIYYSVRGKQSDENEFIACRPAQKDFTVVSEFVLEMKQDIAKNVICVLLSDIMNEFFQPSTTDPRDMFPQKRFTNQDRDMHQMRVYFSTQHYNKFMNKKKN